MAIDPRVLCSVPGHTPDGTVRMPYIRDERRASAVFCRRVGIFLAVLWIATCALWLVGAI